MSAPSWEVLEFTLQLVQPRATEGIMSKCQTAINDLLDMRGQPMGIADAFVSPSSQIMYGAALGLELPTKDVR